MVAMCGHATLASAVVLFGQHPTVEKIAFGISNGTVLNATRLPAGVVSLTLPADESVLAPLAGDDAAREGAVAAALAAAPTLLGHVIAAEKSQRGFIVEVDETVDLKGLVVDPAPFVSRARCPRPVVAAELTPTRLWVSPPLTLCRPPSRPSSPWPRPRLPTRTSILSHACLRPRSACPKTRS